MKLPFFKLKDAFNEARDSFSYGSGGDKIASTAKLLGKSVANIGMLAAEAGIEVVKRAPEMAGRIADKQLKNPHMLSTDQLNRAIEISQKGDEARKLREDKKWENK